MAVKKITKRWIFNSFGAILVILIALEIAIAVSVKNYYYSSVKRIVSAQAETISGLLSEYSTGGEGNYESYFRSLVASFDKRNIMELMVLDKNGRAVITSTGNQQHDRRLHRCAFKSDRLGGVRRRHGGGRKSLFHDRCSERQYG